jgi:hypothetical protein
VLQKAIPSGARGNIAYSAAKAPAAEAMLLSKLHGIPECGTGLAKKR